MNINKKVLERLSDVQRRSESKKHKVGCIILDENNEILSEGYNQSLFGEECESEEDNETFAYVVHAEEIAINKLQPYSDWDSTKILITDFPCTMCSRLILQTSIREVYVIRNFSEEHPNKHLNEFFEKNSNNISMFDVFQKYSVNIYVQEKEGSEEFRKIKSFEEVLNPKEINLIFYADNYNGMFSKFIFNKYVAESEYVIPVTDFKQDSNVCISDDIIGDIRNFIENNSNSKFNLYFLACSPMIDTFDTLLNNFKDILIITVYSSAADYLTNLKAPNVFVFNKNEACQELYDTFVPKINNADKLLGKYVGLISDYYKHTSETFWDFDNETRKEALQFNSYLYSAVFNYNDFKGLITSLMDGWNLNILMNCSYKNIMHKVRKNFESNTNIRINSDGHLVDVLILGISTPYQLQYLSEQFNTSDIRCTWLNFDLENQRILLEIRSISTSECPDEINSAYTLGDYLFTELNDVELKIRRIEKDSKPEQNHCFVSLSIDEFSNLINILKENL